MTAAEGCALDILRDCAAMALENPPPPGGPIDTLWMLLSLFVLPFVLAWLTPSHKINGWAWVQRKSEVQLIDGTSASGELMSRKIKGQTQYRLPTDQDYADSQDWQDRNAI